MKPTIVTLVLFDRRATHWQEPTEAVRPYGTGWRRAIQRRLLRLALLFGARPYTETQTKTEIDFLVHRCS